jgi:hypothetical protein
MSVLEKETTADQYIQRKLKTVSAITRLKGFNVDIYCFFFILRDHSNLGPVVFLKEKEKLAPEDTIISF